LPGMRSQENAMMSESHSNRPKTRTQVGDELSKARNDGAMSRFGNPDPYGPGGAASRGRANPPLTVQSLPRRHQRPPGRSNASALQWAASRIRENAHGKPRL